MRGYPTVADLERRAKRRIPKFAYDFLVGGAGDEGGLRRNRAAFDSIQLVPDYLDPVDRPDTSVELLGRTYGLPFGVAPIGLGCIVWPKAAQYLAASADKANIPFCLSVVASTGLEEAARLGGGNGWFQLYPFRDRGRERHLLDRIEAAGYQTLVVTIDYPVSGRRIRDIRNGLAWPPGIGLATIVQASRCPRWVLETIANGLPRFEIIKPYFEAVSSYQEAARFILGFLSGKVTWRHLEDIREYWKGSLVVKGVLGEADAKRCRETGIDGLIVSNHGGRQLEAAVVPLDVLASIKAATGGAMPVMLDSGVRSGVDVARAFAKGADFVFLGRAFMLAVAALGPGGGDHVIEILKADLVQAMHLLGCRTMADFERRLHESTSASA